MKKETDASAGNAPRQNEQPWIPIGERLPPNGALVETKLDDGHGFRLPGKLKRSGRLWFVPDGKVYVYYTPSHWRPL